MKQGILFTDDDTQDNAPLFFTPADEDRQGDEDGCTCAACKGTKLEVVCERTGAHPDCPIQDVRGGSNHCTLEGKPARIIGRSYPYATIEPVDLDAEPIRCCWDVVEMVMRDGGAFSRTDDDTDE